MRRLSAILVISVFSACAFASKDTSLRSCLDYCMVTMQPGWQMKSCIADCMKRYPDQSQIETAASLFGDDDEGGFCESYEPDCDQDLGGRRDDGRSGVGPDGPIDDGEGDRRTDGHEEGRGWDGL